MADWTALPLNPTRLSVFLVNRATGAPITRLPVYVEIAWTERQQPPPPDDRFEEMVGRALANVDAACDQSAACHAKVTTAFAAAVTRALPQQVRDRLRNGPAADVISIAIDVLRGAVQLLGGGSFTTVAQDQLVPVFDRALREYAAAHGLAANQPFDDEEIRATYPLGVLATDHAGYTSYDLARLPMAVKSSVVEAATALRADPMAQVDAAIWVYPLSTHFEAYEVLRQRRLTVDAVVARLEFTPTAAFPRGCDLGLPSLQSPSLTDWRLSPASFASNPAALVGEDACESLLPANLALQEYHFYQVVRLLDVAPPPPALPNGAALGVVHDYRIAWYSLGHSLGQLLYSLPLAPAESVNLAVIDWTRFDDAERTEATKLNEQIVHNQRRDRTITETVTAAIREYQEGSSFMGGVAPSVGASGAAGGIGIAAGLTGALGGTTSDSSGSRDLSANTVQQLSDNIAQASAAMREFQSTVVVRSAQSEKEAIETRTIVNYNHSHALTILYYEVLRHFRIVTEYVRPRAAVLVKMKTDWFESANVDLTMALYRASLEAALLDPKYKDGFDAVFRVAHRAKLPGAGQASAPDTGAKEFNYFTFYIKTGGQYSEGINFVNIHATLLGPGFAPKPLLGADPGPPDVNINPPGSFRHKELLNTFTALSDPSVKWRQIDAMKLETHLEGSGSTASFKSVKLVAHDTWGGTETLVDVVYDDEVVMTQTTFMYFPIKLAPAKPGPPAASAEEAEDVAKRSELIDHLSAHKAHYSRAIVLAQDPLERAKALEDAGVLAYVENRPLDVIGEWVAYPCTQRAWAMRIIDQVTDGFAAPFDERLVSLPTRGVFADARLGHCNASEEIDNTRFWDWQQSPIPHFAPEIAPVQPVTPQPQQQNLSPTPLPQSLVNIVNPPNAPDPTGMAAALTALAAPNVFRDMSGRAETADLLKRLSDNSIKIAEASSKARQILSNQGGSSGAGGGSATGGGAGGGASGGAKPSGGSGGGGTSMPPSEQLDRMQVVRSAVRNNELTPDEGRQEVKKIVQGRIGGGDQGLSLDDNDVYVRAFFPPKTSSGETYLIGRIEGADASQVATYYLTVLEGEKSGSVEWKSGGGLMTKLFAKRPGVCGIMAQVLSGAVAEGAHAAVEVSVPLFVHVTGSAVDLQAVFAAWNISSQAQEVMRRAEMYVWSVAEGVNVRFIWNVDVGEFADRTVPPQFRAGGFAENYLTRVVLSNTSAAGQAVEVETTGTSEAPAFNGIATVYLGQLGGAAVGPTLNGIADTLASATPPAGAEAFAIELYARVIASIAARAACAAVLSPGSSSGPPTLAEYTGQELAENADASNPASYTDVGREAMQLRATTIATLSELLPVPPKFT
jgi:uncharacterized membrane protein YgcG